jgi:beta-N-acetylhexosaminidase
MRIKTGLEVLLEDKHDKYRHMKFGLVTHPAAVLPDFTHALDALLERGVAINTLFGPEHGIYGFEADAAAVADQIDRRTGLQVYSLYGDHLMPSEEMLKGLDALLFDMQDVGARFYTFISTLYYVMKAAGQSGKEVIVLDRPNPLTGGVWPGPQLEEAYLSFVGILPLPVLHGLTTGEMAAWINDSCDLKVGLEVIRMQGWSRSMWFDETGLPWVPTSPGIPQLSTVVVYPCTCFFEGTNLSEGRGTPLPFEQIGAPWLDGHSFAAALNALVLPGVRFRPTMFKPIESKHAGAVCHGVQVHITDRSSFQPFLTMLHMMDILLRTYPDNFAFIETSWEGTYPHFDLLAGSARLREMLQAKRPVREMALNWKKLQAKFLDARRPFLLYS